MLPVRTVMSLYRGLAEERRDEGAPVREARTFAQILRELPIGLIEGDRLAGDFGQPAFEGMDELGARIAAFERSAAPPADPSSSQLMNDRFHCFGSYTFAHTCLDYEMIVKEGLDGVLKRIDREFEAGPEKAELLEAMTTSLSAVGAFAGRYAEILEAKAGELGGAAADRLVTLAATCRRVPVQPAESFRDALQSIWFVHAAIGLSEGSDASLSLGRLDQFHSRLSSCLRRLCPFPPMRRLRRSCP
jgi:hypothetical protein